MKTYTNISELAKEFKIQSSEVVQQRLLSPDVVVTDSSCTVSFDNVMIVEFTEEIHNVYAVITQRIIKSESNMNDVYEFVKYENLVNELDNNTQITVYGSLDEAMTVFNKFEKGTRLTLITQIEELVEISDDEAHLIANAKISNRQQIEQLVSTFNISIGCYDAVVDQLDCENLKKVTEMLNYGSTDVDVTINSKPYVVEIVHVDDEVDLYVLSKADYISRYGDGRYLPE